MSLFSHLHRMMCPCWHKSLAKAIFSLRLSREYDHFAMATASYIIEIAIKLEECLFILFQKIRMVK